MKLNYQSALEYAQRMHVGQTRIGGDPYISHPIAVSQIVAAWGCGMECQIAALFHDLLEDTDASEEKIMRMGGADVLEAVKLLTKKPGYVMKDYVAGIRANPIAFRVKAADRLHNLRSALCADAAFRRRYIAETRQWYMDFCPEIPEAVEALENSLGAEGR